MLQKLIAKGRVPSALLLAGQNKAALVQEAKRFAETLVPSIADRFEYVPEGKVALHTVERMRELKEEVYLPPYQGDKKVFLLFDAERMWPQSSNALLKTFEEPLPTSYFVLTTTRREKILPTILSRCQTYWIKGQKDKAPLLPEVEELLAHGKYADTRSFFQQTKIIAAEFEKIEEPLLYQESVKELLEQLEERFPRMPYFDEARLKLERSTSLSAILESLFIKLGIVN